MKRPSFQFYPADWRNNAKLRRCSPAARGVWMDVLCLLHDGDDYGVLRWPLKDIAQAVGATAAVMRELVDKQVLKGADAGPVKFVYTPRSGGQDGDPVTLIETEGPCWYSSRFVRDEHVRQSRGGSTRFGRTEQPPEGPPDTPPNRPVGSPLGDGATSSSSSSSTSDTRKETSSPSSPSGPEGGGLDLGLGSPGPVPPAAPRNDPVPFEQVVGLYNHLCPTLPRAELTDARRRFIRARWGERLKRQQPPLDWFTDLFTRAEASDFLTGRDNKSIKRWNLDDLLTPKHSTRIMEGGYANKKGSVNSKWDI